VNFYKGPAAKQSEPTAWLDPGTKWRPLHRKPHQDNRTITIRRFISLAQEKKL